MKKWKGFLSAIIAVLIIAPLSIVNAQVATLTSVNVNVTSPVGGTSLEATQVQHPGDGQIPGWTETRYEPLPSVSFGTSNVHAGYTAWNSGLPSSNPTFEEPFTGSFVTGNFYYFELYIMANEGYAFPDDLDDLTINVNNAVVDYEVSNYHTAEQIEMFVKVKAVAPTNGTTTVPEKFTVSFENVYGFYWDDDTDFPFDDQEVEKDGYATDPQTINDTIYVNNLYYIFEGWYTDADFKNAFTFDKKITKDTTLYAKFVNAIDLTNKVREEVEDKLVVKSTLTEKEALELYKADDLDQIVDTLSWTNPTLTVDGVSLVDLSIDFYQYEDGDISYFCTMTYCSMKASFTYKNIDFLYEFDLRTNIVYADSDKHDADLDEKAAPYKDEDRSIPGFIDYTRIPKSDETKDLMTEEEISNLHKDNIDKLVDSDGFDFIVVSEDTYISVRYADKDGYYVLTKNDLNYASFNYWTEASYMIIIDPAIENNRKAYIESVKDKIEASLKNKGYTKIIFVEDYFYYNVLYVKYGTDEDDEDDLHVSEIYMMKDKDTFLLANNLTANFKDKILYHLRAYSYSDCKDEIDTDDVESIEKMKESLEKDGLDFFEGYYIYSEIPEGYKATLTFNVGTNNNNRKIRVLHEKEDGTIETFDGIVKDGQFSIEVTETSPFAVGLGEVVKALKNNPQTFDPIMLSVLILVLSTLGLIGGSIYFYKSRLN